MKTFEFVDEEEGFSNFHVLLLVFNQLVAQDKRLLTNLDGLEIRDDLAITKVCKLCGTR